MSLTNVPPERQKILGLVKGKLPNDNERMYVRHSITFKYKYVLKSLPQLDNVI